MLDLRKPVYTINTPPGREKARALKEKHGLGAEWHIWSRNMNNGSCGCHSHDPIIHINTVLITNDRAAAEEAARKGLRVKGL